MSKHESHKEKEKGGDGEERKMEKKKRKLHTMRSENEKLPEYKKCALKKSIRNVLDSCMIRLRHSCVLTCLHIFLLFSVGCSSNDSPSVVDLANKKQCCVFIHP